MKNAVAYLANPRQCPACSKEQAPQADSKINPVTRSCDCGMKWKNVFVTGRHMGYDPKVV